MHEFCCCVALKMFKIICEKGCEKNCKRFDLKRGLKCCLKWFKKTKPKPLPHPTHDPPFFPSLPPAAQHLFRPINPAGPSLFLPSLFFQPASAAGRRPISLPGPRGTAGPPYPFPLFLTDRRAPPVGVAPYLPPPPAPHLAAGRPPSSLPRAFPSSLPSGSKCAAAPLAPTHHHPSRNPRTEPLPD
jgi:hypothetical protein